MSTFVYKVRDVRGIPNKGELEAESRAAVASELRNKGYTVVDINEKSAGTSFSNILADSKRIKSKNITVFSRQFATMINSGLALLRALYHSGKSDTECQTKAGNFVRSDPTSRAVAPFPTPWKSIREYSVASMSAWSEPAKPVVSWMKP